jgi:hypothetical protein
LKWLLNLCNGVCFLRGSSSEVIDGQHRVALGCGIFNPAILFRAVRVARKTEPVALSMSSVFWTASPFSEANIPSRMVLHAEVAGLLSHEILESQVLADNTLQQYCRYR